MQGSARRGKALPRTRQGNAGKVGQGKNRAVSGEARQRSEKHEGKTG